MPKRSPEAEDDTENRRKQLRAWIDAHYDKSPARFISEKELNQSEISGLLNKKSFGSVKARNLERQAGMPPRYLEERSTVEPGSSASMPAVVRFLLDTNTMVQLPLREFTNLFAGLPKATRRAALAVLEGVVENPAEAEEIAGQMTALLGYEASPSSRWLIWADRYVVELAQEYAAIPHGADRAALVFDAKAALRGHIQEPGAGSSGQERHEIGTTKGRLAHAKTQRAQSSVSPASKRAVE